MCGGALTEPTYLRGLKKHLGGVADTFVIKTLGAAPKRVVQEAARQRNRGLYPFRDVWCILDVDDFDLEATKKLAAKEKVNLAISDPCFEIWLLLHHEDCRSHFPNYAAVRDRLRKHTSAYDKSKLKFDDFASGVESAIKRARLLGDEGNPSTSMWKVATQMKGGEVT